MLIKYRRWLIYVIIFIASFSTFCLLSLKSQYIYLRVAESYNTTGKGRASCGNTSTEIDALVSQEASRWTLKLNICLFIPGSIIGFLVTSWSDKVGRKTAMTVPATGMILASLSFALTIWFNWPLATLYICNFVSGISGYYMTLLIQGNAFLSDIVEPEERCKLFVILDTCIGIGGGIAGIVSGIWLKTGGYFEPIVASGILSTAVLVLIFFLPDSTRIKQENNKTKEEEKESLLSNDVTQSILENDTIENDVQIRERSSLITNNAHPRLYESCDHPVTSDEHVSPEKSSFLKVIRSVWSVYSSEYSHCEKCFGSIDENERHSEDRCCHGGGIYPGRVWRLWIYLISDAVYMFVFVGTMEFQTIFNLSPPLCFTPVLIGTQVSLKFSLIAMEPFLVMIYQRLFLMSNNIIIVTGFIAFVLSTITMGLSTEPYLIFIGTAVMGPAFPAKPVIQAQMSNLVSQNEQGSVYALVSFSETLTYLISSVTFLMLYPATVEIFRGFTWLFASVMVFIPIIPMMVVTVKDYQRKMQQANDRSDIVT